MTTATIQIEHSNGKEVIQAAEAGCCAHPVQPVTVILQRNGTLLMVTESPVIARYSEGVSRSYGDIPAHAPLERSVDTGMTALSPSQSPGAKTRLGAIILRYRRQIVASGLKLLNWDEINEETRERRGSAIEEQG